MIFERLKELVDIAQDSEKRRMSNIEIIMCLYEIDKSLAEEYKTIMNLKRF